ncbi:hypothetical protein [Stenotrophomonas sp.]|uniref:hypothetical protein n=1 Tax=Stenotrophomonas sp. TaxID=69392 RepID=UPI00289E647C|nr:hypothetical protein [Stenotrophomonas sp.]
MPAAGDIHVVHNERLQAFVAYQLTHQDVRDGSLALLTLDWTGATLPDPAALAAMQPARFNYLQQDNALHHLGVGKQVPRDFQRVGWRAPDRRRAEPVRQLARWIGNRTPAPLGCAGCSRHAGFQARRHRRGPHGSAGTRRLPGAPLCHPPRWRGHEPGPVIAPV